MATIRRKHLKVTDIFRKKVGEVWGNSKLVADAALNELFRHGNEINLDYDDQIGYAMQIGLLAGELNNSDADTFIKRFEDEVLTDD